MFENVSFWTFRRHLQKSKVSKKWKSSQQAPKSSQQVPKSSQSTICIQSKRLERHLLETSKIKMSDSKEYYVILIYAKCFIKQYNLALFIFISLPKSLTIR